MIRHPGARTRALYAWEADDLETRLRDAHLRPRDIRRYLQVMNFNENAPSVTIIQSKSNPYCEGYSRIVLTVNTASRLMLVHELTHAKRYGSIRNPHGTGFVRAYCRYLALVFQWNDLELECQARLRGLL